MYSAIHVTNAPVASAPPLRVDTVVAMDYAFRSASRLKAGVHYFALVNTGKQRHEVAVALLKKGVTLPDFGLHAQPATSPAGLLRIDLLPGRTYLLECGFSDTDKSPPHYKLGMYGVIAVP